MKYKAWDKSGKVEKDFEKALNKFTEAFKRLASKSNSISDFQDKMDRFQQSKEFQDMILLYVRKMVTPIATMNMSTWRKAARKHTLSGNSRNRLFTGKSLRQYCRYLPQSA